MDLVHRLHRLDDEQGLAFLHRGADLDEVGRTRRGRQVDRADHRRLHRAGMIAAAVRLRGARVAARRVRHGRGRQVPAVLRGHVRHRSHRLCHAHLGALAVKLDFGQAGAVEDLGEARDQVEVGIRPWAAGFAAALADGFLDGGIRQPFLLAVRREWSAEIAST